MNLDPALLEILACPNCHGELTADEAAERLVCHDCGYRYPVRDDIPVMLIDEADKPDGAVGPGGPASTGA
ncbi:MAG TPA: Trm112 family protein [Frankiaceae bacterium]|nr:Trm112 family protein [Frankiaceae bacterium]